MIQSQNALWEYVKIYVYNGKHETIIDYEYVMTFYCNLIRLVMLRSEILEEKHEISGVFVSGNLKKVGTEYMI